MNLHPDSGKFQLCCGPVILPDMATWDGKGVDRVFLAEVASQRLRLRGVHPAPRDRAGRERDRSGSTRCAAGIAWNCGIRTTSRRNRMEVQRPRPHVYHETWALDAENVILRAP